MSTVLAKWVWIERVMVLLANVGVNLGIANTSDVSEVQSGSIIGVIVFVQIVVAGVTHWRTLETKIRADVAGILSALLDADVVPSMQEIAASQTDPAIAAKLAGKAITP